MSNSNKKIFSSSKRSIIIATSDSNSKITNQTSASCLATMRSSGASRRPRETSHEQRKDASWKGASRARAWGPSKSAGKQATFRAERGQEPEHPAATGGRSHAALPRDERKRQRGQHEQHRHGRQTNARHVHPDPTEKDEGGFTELDIS